MTRQDKVQAYNTLALNQRRKDYKIGSPRWEECGSELIKSMNKLPRHLYGFVYANFNNNSIDWVSELSNL